MGSKGPWSPGRSEKWRNRAMGLAASMLWSEPQPWQLPQLQRWTCPQNTLFTVALLSGLITKTIHTKFSRALEATASCLKNGQARVSRVSVEAQKGAELPRNSSHYLQLDGTLLEGKTQSTSVHTYPEPQNTGPAGLSNTVLNRLKLPRHCPYRVTLGANKTYVSGFFHNLCPEAVKRDACPTKSS